MTDQKKSEIPKYDELKREFCDGTIFDASDEDLLGAIQGLSSTAEPNEGIRHHYVVMSHAIQSIQLRRLLHELEQRNNRMQKWFVILTFSALLAAMVQVVVAVLSATVQVGVALFAK